MKDFYKEKIKVDLDLLKLYSSFILALAAGLVTLVVRTNFGENNADYVFFFIGFLGLIFFSFVSIRYYKQIRKDLHELKNL